MKLPKKYEWLHKETAPRHLLKALELHGTTEIVGQQSNPVIMGWAQELSIKHYSNDDIPWCGLFVAIVIHRAGRPVVKDPLWARNWANFGVAVKEPMLGDVLVFSRDKGGHVGIYTGESKTHYHVLGGNQSNQVSIVLIAKNRLIASRRPAYNVQPLNVRKIVIDSTGTIVSTNEA
jgi:uncharacterized protein (TIGR02594 family)